MLPNSNNHITQVVTDYGFMFISPKEISIAGDNKAKYIRSIYINH